MYHEVAGRYIILRGLKHCNTEHNFAGSKALQYCITTLYIPKNTIGIVEQFKLLVLVVLGLCKPGRGRKRISKGSGNGNMEESMITVCFYR